MLFSRWLITAAFCSVIAQTAGAFDAHFVKEADYDKFTRELTAKYEDLSSRSALDDALYARVQTAVRQVRDSKERKSYPVLCFEKISASKSTYHKDGGVSFSDGPSEADEFVRFEATITNEREGVFSMSSIRGAVDIERELERFTKVNPVTESSTTVTFNDHVRKGFYLSTGWLTPMQVKIGPFPIKLGKGRLGYHFSVSPLDDQGDVYFEIDQTDILRTAKNELGEKVRSERNIRLVCH